MIKIKREGILLKPTSRWFEDKSVLNPGAYQEGNTVHLIYRTITKKFVSYLGYAQLQGPTKIIKRSDKPFFEPIHKYERKGVEDPRIVKIGNIFYLTYVVHDGKNALSAYAYGKDLFNLKRGGIITPRLSYDAIGDLFAFSKLKDEYYFFKSYYKDAIARDVLLWDKDTFFFPEKIKRKYALVHRILPDIQLVYFNNFSQLKDKNFWINNIKQLSKFVILEGVHGFEDRNVGGGCPPIKTKYGWLLIYHGVEQINKQRTYHAGVALLDLKDPTKIIARLPYPLFSPKEKWEVYGHIHHVVFPTGTAIFKNRLYIYYGAADTCVAVASVETDKLLKELMKFKVSKNK